MKVAEVIHATRRLELTGMTRPQAETTVDVFQELVEPLATNAALAATEKLLRADMKKMEESIRADMKKMEESIRADMKKMEESIRADMAKMEESIRMSLESDLAAMETRLFWKLSA